MRIRAILSCSVALVAVVACHRPGAGDEHMTHMSAGDMAAPAVAPAAQGNPALPPSNPLGPFTIDVTYVLNVK